MAASAEHLARLSGVLTSRDRWLVRMLAEHRTLSSTQIIELAFPSRRAANLRLHQLYCWRLVDRFQPYIGRGRAPMFYVLDTAGAHTLAFEDGLDPAELKFRAERSLGIAHSLRLAHLHGVNSVFTTLIAHAHAQPQTVVSAWWPETRCTRHFGDLVRPDAYGRWRENDRALEFFLEFDTGSYPLSRLVAKLPGYARLTTTTRITTPILICFTGPSREAHARTALAEHTRGLPQPEAFPIATTNTDQVHNQTSPANAVWLPLEHSEAGRIRLIDLSRSWPYLPAPTTASDAPAPENSAPARLSPPTPMPPWSTEELTWKNGR